jgi:hypothetical protein
MSTMEKDSKFKKLQTEANRSCQDLGYTQIRKYRRR